MDINVDFLQWFIISLIKTSSRIVKNEITSNKELAEKLHKAVIRKFNKKSILTFNRQYLGCRSTRYAIDK